MPDAIDAPPAELALVKSILRRFVPDRGVWAFGSRGHGRPRPHSDLDVAILGATRIPLATVAGLRSALEESPLSFPVDLVEWGGRVGGVPRPHRGAPRRPASRAIAVTGQAVAAGGVARMAFARCGTAPTRSASGITSGGAIRTTPLPACPTR